MSQQNNGVEKSTLEVQLQEVNKRSQFYLAQFWQVPMAYLGVTLLAVSANYNTKQETVTLLVMVVSIVAGIFVLLHMFSMIKGNRRATKNIIAIEKALRLDLVKDHTLAKLASIFYWLPLLLVVTLTVAACIILLLKKLCISV